MREDAANSVPGGPIGSGPSPGRVVRTLRDGFWDRTEVLQLPDGTLRVRKASKGDPAAGPWGAETLRREIRCLRDLEPAAAACFPRLLAAWDDGRRLGYEMTYLAGTVDAGELARRGAMSQAQADAFQDRLAEVVFGVIHRPVEPAESLARHVGATMADVLGRLAGPAECGRLLAETNIELNGERLLGPRAAMDRLAASPGLAARLDEPPCVRLHGDLFLENILLPSAGADADAGGAAGLVLLDPVSVAGVRQGHPLFDLVKYESYATGELPALRTERLIVEGFDPPGGGRYVYGVRWEDPALQPFRRVDWSGRFRAAYVRAYGPADRAAYHLLEAYFALVMAACTGGLQRRGRLLKATWALNAALGAAASPPPESLPR